MLLSLSTEAPSHCVCHIQSLRSKMPAWSNFNTQGHEPQEARAEDCWGHFSMATAVFTTMALMSFLLMSSFVYFFLPLLN